jgi:hypothetical protein
MMCRKRFRTTLGFDHGQAEEVSRASEVARSAKHQGSSAARRRWAKNPKWRMRTKPFGSTCKRSASGTHRGQPHQSLLILMGGVTPAEYDFPILQGHQAVIGDGHPVRVTAEIAERMLGPAEWGLA